MQRCLKTFDIPAPGLRLGVDKVFRGADERNMQIEFKSCEQQYLKANCCQMLAQSITKSSMQNCSTCTSP